MNCAVLHDAAFGSAQTRFRFRLSTDMPPVVANGGIAGGSHEHQANPGSTSRSASHTGEIEMALSAAKALGAHVQALFISQPPPVTRGGVTGSELGRTATVASVNGLAEERERTVRDVFFSSRRRHTRFDCDWSSDVCSSD